MNRHKASVERNRPIYTLNRPSQNRLRPGIDPQKASRIGGIVSRALMHIDHFLLVQGGWCWEPAGLATPSWDRAQVSSGAGEKPMQGVWEDELIPASLERPRGKRRERHLGNKPSKCGTVSNVGLWNCSRAKRGIGAQVVDRPATARKRSSRKRSAHKSCALHTCLHTVRLQSGRAPAYRPCEASARSEVTRTSPWRPISQSVGLECNSGGNETLAPRSPLPGPQGHNEKECWARQC